MRKKIITAERLPQLLSQTIQDRFWSKITKFGPNDCWPWNAGVNWDGYGVMTVRLTDGMIQVRAPQLAWVSEHKTLIPEGKIILHSCKQQPRCCNPAHLRPGTQRENIQDEIDQGTFVHGESHGMARLKAEQVIEIRRLRSLGLKLQEIAGIFGISFCTVSAIAHKRLWKHI